MNRSLALNNNLKSAFKPSLAGSLNVVFNAGTRFEDNQGVANVLKNFAFRVSISLLPYAQPSHTPFRTPQSAPVYVKLEKLKLQVVFYTLHSQETT